jgi:hypothetical protein
MSTPKLLIPLRIPELGPSLGKLVTGTGRNIDGFSLESHRHHLTTKIIEMGGEARRLAANDERSAAIAALGRDAWLAAWEETVGPIAEAVVDRLTAHLEAESAAVRMPRRLRAKVAIDEVERRAIGARLGSAGAQLIPELDEIERQSAVLLEALASGRDTLVAWQQAQLTAARHLEEAWMALEDSVDQELAAWRGVADRIARWRKPLWPVFVVGALGTAVAAWAGLIWGGIVPVPGWLERLWEVLRSLGA